MNKLLIPFSSLYRVVTDIRNILYEKKILAIHDFSVPVVSVGNITMGGTGKTPIICELLNWALKQNLKPAMISRGYKRTGKDVMRVGGDVSGSVYGDEPAMVARRFPTVPVYVGSDRIKVMKKLIENENVQIVFADDAFQHRRLNRKIDIVVIDCTEKIENYNVLPYGRGREDKIGLRRADFIILNKGNLTAPEHKQRILEFIDQICGDLPIPIIESDYYLSRIVRLDGLLQDKSDSYEKIVLMSGIGNPQSFEFMMNHRFDIKKHFIFKDHHVYTINDMQKIIKESGELGIRKIVTTEKDAVKLIELPLEKEKIWVAELAPKLSIRMKSLYEKILIQIN